MARSLLMASGLLAVVLCAVVRWCGSERERAAAPLERVVEANTADANALEISRQTLARTVRSSMTSDGGWVIAGFVSRDGVGVEAHVEARALANQAVLDLLADIDEPAPSDKQALLTERGPPLASAKSEPSGSFVLQAPAIPLRVTAVSSHGCGSVEVFDSRDVVIQIESGTEVVFAVTEAGTGESVHDYELAYSVDGESPDVIPACMGDGQYLIWSTRHAPKLVDVKCRGTSDCRVAVSLERRVERTVEVVDERGAPIRGAEVVASGSVGASASSCVTNADGRCLLRHLSGRGALVNVTGRGFCRAAAVARPGSERIVLSRGDKCLTVIGVGVVVTRSAIPSRGNTIVYSVQPNTPAERAGVQIGESVLSIDGRPVSQLPLDEVRSQLRGPIGSEVVLELQGVDGSRIVKLARELLTIDEE